MAITQETTKPGIGAKPIGLVAGPIVAVITALLIPDSLSFEGRAVAGIALWMAIWWMTEAAPIPVTSLLPVVLFPIVGAGTMKEVTSPYAGSVVFLVLGGVLLGLATERSNLHVRIALWTIKVIGTRPSQMVFGLMIASAFISAWVSNTATAVIMVPIATSVLAMISSIDKEAASKKFAASLLLGVAYGVTIGSTATLIGQPPMPLMKAYLLETHNYDMSFGRWMLVGVPWAIVMLLIAWVVLAKFVFRSEVSEIAGGAEMIEEQIQKLGPLSTSERRVAAIFGTAILFWVVVPLLPLPIKFDDTQVAIAAAVLCFLVPAGKDTANKGRKYLLEWEDSKDVPWGLLLLFGGGLSLSAMFTATGLSEWVGQQVSGLQSLPHWVILLAVMIVSLALTELTSNTATAAAFLPIFGSVAVGLGIDPLLMTVTVTLAVCSAYMLPVATPSNAVAYGSGEISVAQMARAGVWLNFISIAVIMAVLYTLVPLVFGISIS
ncbi:SLC13 family permease [Corynebacterium riegelii]|uniref:SLC13 family permease n=1 Tax=Corynebacterium riegelii TaxID=156976 RepID=UPI000C781754|nr:DASS family sodium-coupled anion symporter [Corynebacterium riegelii]PLA12132.1 anion transporter [Corynebacterium riegelii]